MFGSFVGTSVVVVLRILVLKLQKVTPLVGRVYIRGQELSRAGEYSSSSFC